MRTPMMRFLFGKHHEAKLDEIDHLAHLASLAHERNIKSIASVRETADNLKRVLEQNHISIQILNATGNTNNATTRHQSKP